MVRTKEEFEYRVSRMGKKEFISPGYSWAIDQLKGEYEILCWIKEYNPGEETIKAKLEELKRRLITGDFSKEYFRKNLIKGGIMGIEWYLNEEV